MPFIKKYAFSIISIAIAFIILMAFCLTGNRLGQLLDYINTIRLPWIGLAALCMLAYFLLEGAALYVLIRRLVPRYKYRHAFVSGMVGLLYNALTPFSTGGQPVQLYHMSKNGVEAGAAGSVIAVKSIHYQFVLIVFSICAMFIGFGFFVANVAGYLSILAVGLLINALVATAMLVCSLSLRVLEKLLGAARWLLKRLRVIKSPEAVVDSLDKALREFHKGVRAFGYKGIWTQARAFGIMCVQQLLYCAIPFLVYMSFGLKGASAPLMISAMSFVSTISVYMPTPGASGAAEGSFYLFFNMFFAGGTLVPALLIWRVLTYYGQMLCGALTVAVDTFLGKRRRIGSAKCEIRPRTDE